MHEADFPSPAEFRTWTLKSGSPPLFIEPLNDSAAGLDGFIGWVRDNLHPIKALLVEHGARVVRGFAVGSAKDFSRFVALFDRFAAGYAGGAAARRELAVQVYEASQYAAPLKLQLHQEMAYARDYPGRIAFFCRKPAEQGGETIICDMRRITRDIPSDLRAKLQGHGILNVRNFTAPPQDGTEERASEHPDQKSWKAGFFTDDRAEVEAICARKGMEPVWHPDDSLTVKTLLPAFEPHPATGESVYRSIVHLDQYSDGAIAKLPPEVREPILEMFRKQVIRSGYYLGDGTPLGEDEVAAFGAIYRQHETAWSWQAGDILLVDNLLVAHGRNPYAGTRDVQVGLLE